MVYLRTQHAKYRYRNELRRLLDFTSPRVGKEKTYELFCMQWQRRKAFPIFKVSTITIKAQIREGRNTNQKYGKWFACPWYVHICCLFKSLGCQWFAKVTTLFITCVSTIAVCLEFVKSCSVPASFQAFRRFTTRKCLPIKIICCS